MLLKQTEARATSIVVCQADDAYRIGITSVLGRATQSMVVAGQAATAEEAVRVVEELKPNVALVSGYFPDSNGIEVAKKIKQLSPHTKVIMVTRDDCAEHIFAAFDAGAEGYFLHSATPEQLLSAVRAVDDGSVCMDPGIARKILDVCKFTGQLPKRRAHVLDSCFGLTNRELQVLGLIVEGQSNAEIARQLFLNEETIKTHVHDVMQKLSVSDRTQAAVMAIKERVFTCTCYANAITDISKP
jgi:DNA-binding NarL/FixJ family response regulator